MWGGNCGRWGGERKGVTRTLRGKYGLTFIRGKGSLGHVKATGCKEMKYLFPAQMESLKSQKVSGPEGPG